MTDLHYPALWTALIVGGAVPLPAWEPGPDLVPWLEQLRWANVALTIIVTAGLGMRINDIWAGLTWGRKIIFTGMLLFPLVGAYGSYEAYAQAAPVGLRTPLVTLACGVTLLGLWISRHDQEKAPYVRPEGEPGGMIDFLRSRPWRNR